MADRDFNIPTGPDRTGRFSIPEVEPGSGAPADQTIAQAPISTADLRGFDVEVAPAGEQPGEVHPVDAWLSTPMDAVPAVDPVPAPAEAPAGDASAAPEARTDSASVQPAALPTVVPQPAKESQPAESLAGEELPKDADGAKDAEDTEASDESSGDTPITDVAASLGALKDSIDQGRELKAREKDRDDLASKIDLDREELADRDDILANYQTIVAEQDRIIAQSTQNRDAYKAELSQVVAQTEETTDALTRMRDYHDVQLQPLETALGRAQATADQAKNDERSRKSELNAAETEVKRAEDGDDATTARARLDVVQDAYNEAVSRSNAAKEALEEAQRAYDTLKDQVEQAEAPLENALDDLDRRTAELKETIARLGDSISAASKRRQYCDSVYQYPAETEKLRQSVESDEAALDRLDEENDELRVRLAESKAKSMKAKVFIGVVIALIVVFVCLFWYLSTR